MTLNLNPQIFEVVGCYTDAVRDLGFVVRNLKPLETGWRCHVVEQARIAPRGWLEPWPDERTFHIEASSPKELRDKLMVLI